MSLHVAPREPPLTIDTIYSIYALTSPVTNCDDRGIDCWSSNQVICLITIAVIFTLIAALLVVSLLFMKFKDRQKIGNPIQVG